MAEGSRFFEEKGAVHEALRKITRRLDELGIPYAVAIKILILPLSFAEQLDPYVRDKNIELWRSTRQTEKRYVTIWRNRFLTLDAKSLPEMIELLKRAAATLEAMRADGVELDPDGGTADDHAYLVTADPEVARKYDMMDESEIFPDEDYADEAPTRDRAAS